MDLGGELNRTLWKINIEPTNHPIEKENHLNQTSIFDLSSMFQLLPSDLLITQMEVTKPLKGSLKPSEKVTGKNLVNFPRVS